MSGKYEHETTEEFISRLASTVSEGYKAMSIAFGHQSGLLKTMVDIHTTPKTSQEIADAAGLKERYVREWLGAMVCGGIIEIDEASEKYHLPTHRVPAFKEGSAESQITALSVGLPMMSEAYSAMLEVIKKDGPLGNPYSKYEMFHEFMAAFTIKWFDNHLCQTFVPSLPALKEGLEKGIRVLDVGCGRGGAARNFALHFPKSTVVGLDISAEAVGYATEEAKSKNMTNLEYVCHDATAMPAEWTDTFDYVFIFDSVHDMPRSDLLLAEIGRVLKPGGMFSCFEPNVHSRHVDNIDVPHAGIYYTISLFHCLPVSSYFPGSMALGACWGREEAVKLLQKTGFAVQAIQKQVAGGGDVLHYWCTQNTQ